MRRVGCTPRTVSWKAFERKQTDTRSVRSLSLQGGSGSIQCQVPLRSRRTRVQVGSCPRKKERSEAAVCPSAPGAGSGAGSEGQSCAQQLHRPQQQNLRRVQLTPAGSGQVTRGHACAPRPGPAICPPPPPAGKLGEIVKDRGDPMDWSAASWGLPGPARCSGDWSHTAPCPKGVSF